MRLFAFWRYDTYPYVLGGEVSEVLPDGKVKIPSYQGVFKPIKIVPYVNGIEILDKLHTLEASYKAELERLRYDYTLRAREFVPEI